ncbi:MAG: DNA-deoxyinosine glycosylase [Lachnospiraceae bacterium]|nr:DNA-deoxyinosine glycosylase [Lachnospiraceae bacterium]
MEASHIIHPIPPTYDSQSEVLVLGSFPSIKSREMKYFYGHPQNRFWRVMAAVFEEPVPMTVEERHAFLLRNHVAAWDVIASCTITGSSDSSIRDVVVNDLSEILKTAPVRQIYVNGRKAEEYYKKYTQAMTGRAAICLPSTSPANAAWSLERLIPAWQRVRRGE